MLGGGAPVEIGGGQLRHDGGVVVGGGDRHCGGGGRGGGGADAQGLPSHVQVVLRRLHPQDVRDDVVDLHVADQASEEQLLHRGGNECFQRQKPQRQASHTIGCSRCGGVGSSADQHLNKLTLYSLLKVVHLTSAAEVGIVCNM